MAVYVDNMRAAFGRMRMCHMVADTAIELVEMADTIGVHRKWIQHPGTAREHFDVCLSKRDLAVAAGARLVSQRELVGVMRGKVADVHRKAGSKPAG